MKNKKLMLIPMLILVISLLAGTALASESDTAGNSFLGDIGDDGKCVSSESAQRDLYWFGYTLDLDGSDTGADAIFAGNALNVKNSSFGGSIRMAGYNLSLADTSAENNITAAGYSVNMNSGVKAAGVIAIGNIVTFDGECDALMLSGGTVYFNGTVNGDASISANEVVLGSDAVVNGHLDISSSTEPSVPAGIADYSFTAVSSEDEASRPTAAQSFGRALGERAYMIAAMLVVALLLCLVASPELDKSGKTLLAHPVAMPVTGLVTLCALPVAAILLCVTFIGLPTVGLLALLTGAICFFGVAFAGASAGRLVFPNMNKILASLIGVAVLVLLRAVPYLGGLLAFLSIVYTMGFFILVCYERIKALKKQPEVEIEAVAVETPAEGE